MARQVTVRACLMTYAQHQGPTYGKGTTNPHKLSSDLNICAQSCVSMHARAHTHTYPSHTQTHREVKKAKLTKHEASYKRPMFYKG